MFGSRTAPATLSCIIVLLTTACGGEGIASKSPDISSSTPSSLDGAPTSSHQASAPTAKGAQGKQLPQVGSVVISDGGATMREDVYMGELAANADTPAPADVLHACNADSSGATASYASLVLRISALTGRSTAGPVYNFGPAVFDPTRTSNFGGQLVLLVNGRLTCQERLQIPLVSGETKDIEGYLLLFSTPTSQERDRIALQPPALSVTISNPSSVTTGPRAGICGESHFVPVLLPFATLPFKLQTSYGLIICKRGSA